MSGFLKADWLSDPPISTCGTGVSRPAAEGPLPHRGHAAIGCCWTLSRVIRWGTTRYLKVINKRHVVSISLLYVQGIWHAKRRASLPPEHVCTQTLWYWYTCMHRATETHILQSKIGCSAIPSPCCPLFQMCLRPLLQICLRIQYWNETFGWMFTATFSMEKKNRCVCMWMKGSLRQFLGAFLLKLFRKLLHDVLVLGLLCSSVCTVCVRACVCVCVCVCVWEWACRHVPKQVINQRKSVTLSSAWKHLCSLRQDWFISERPMSCSRASLLITSARFNKLYAGDSSCAAKAIVVISNGSKNINNTLVQNVVW